MLRGFFGNLIFAIIARMLCGIHLKLCMTRNFFSISLFERAFKMMKTGVYFTVIALLVADLFKMTCDVTLWTQNDVKSQKMEYI